MTQQQVGEQTVMFRDTLLRLEQQGQSALPTMVDLFTEDARLTNAALQRRGEEHHGRASIQEFWQHYLELLGEERTTFTHLLTSDTAGGLFWHTTLPHGGGAYEGVTLLTFGDDGKVASMMGYYDPDVVRRELTPEV